MRHSVAQTPRKLSLLEPLNSCLDYLDERDASYWSEKLKPDVLQSDIKSWQALVKLFSKLKFDDSDDVWAGALAVYGWMPRALRTVHCSTQVLKLVQDIRAAAGGYCEAKASFDVIAGRSCYQLLCACPKLLTALETASKRGKEDRSISSVGMSKFLHFLAPHVLPIWDSRTARALHVTNHYSAEYFLEYTNTLHGVLAHGRRAPRLLVDRLGSVSGLKPSDVRAMEFALYIHGEKSPARETT